MPKPFVTAAALVLACSLLPLALQGQQAVAGSMTILPGAIQRVTAPPATSAADYVLGASDIVHITVWKEPELTQNAVVRPDGKISFPLVGEVPIAGLSVLESEALLREKLASVLAKPQVTLTVAEIHSRQVYITGEVGHPGAYPLSNSMNVLQLIASAGGLTQYAHKKSIYILRSSDAHPLHFNYTQVAKGKDSVQNIALLPGDTVVIP